jgi:hypothetical protein
MKADERIFRRYVAAAECYLSNSMEMLSKNEPSKAGELLWGAVVAGTKAAAASKGMKNLKYGPCKRFAQEAARDLKQPDLFHTFLAAESFHGKFYESATTMEEVEAVLEAAREYIATMLRAAGFDPSRADLGQGAKS